MQQITINKLYELCKKQIEKGNGDKVIAISNDNEGNGYHGLFYGFTVVTDYEEWDIEDSVEDDVIILG